jgi:hypothetical protein
VITSVHMSSQERMTIHIKRPTEEDHALLRLLSPAEKLQALLAAAKAKAARLGTKDTQREIEAGNESASGAHQDAN